MKILRHFSFSQLDPKKHCLFLDHDGTSALFVPPEEAHNAYALPGFKETVAGLIDVGFKVAYVSGRPIETPFQDKPCGSLQHFYGEIAASGLHGLEFCAYPGALVERPAGLPLIDDQTWLAAECLSEAHEGAMVEYKARTNLCFHVASVADSLQDVALRDFAQHMERFLAGNPLYKLQAGHKILELCPGEIDGAKVDKGMGVKRFMARNAWEGLTPVAFGDDAKRWHHGAVKTGTDEYMFEAVQELGGLGVLVGPQSISSDCLSVARNSLPDQWALLAGLQSVVRRLQPTTQQAFGLRMAVGPALLKQGF